jgi:hypothetical protein
MLFFGGLYFARREWRAEYVVRGCDAGCPRCGHTLELKSGSTLSLPHEVSCPGCRRTCTLSAGAPTPDMVGRTVTHGSGFAPPPDVDVAALEAYWRRRNATSVWSPASSDWRGGWDRRGGRVRGRGRAGAGEAPVPGSGLAAGSGFDPAPLARDADGRAQDPPRIGAGSRCTCGGSWRPTHGTAAGVVRLVCVRAARARPCGRFRPWARAPILLRKRGCVAAGWPGATGSRRGEGWQAAASTD